jgi:hypothetical protein
MPRNPARQPRHPGCADGTGRAPLFGRVPGGSSRRGASARALAPDPACRHPARAPAALRQGLPSRLGRGRLAASEHRPAAGRGRSIPSERAVRRAGQGRLGDALRQPVHPGGPGRAAPSQRAPGSGVSALSAVFRIDHRLGVRRRHARAARWRWLPELRFINQYHDEPAYIDAVAESIRNHWATQGEPERLLFSFHGIPKDYFENGDPYFCHCQKTARLVTDRLGLPRIAGH